MRDDEMVTVPKVVLADMDATGPHGWSRKMAPANLRLARDQGGSTLGTLTKWWLQTFDQDPVTVPDECFGETPQYACGFSLMRKGENARSRADLVAYAQAWSSFAVGPLTKRFLSLFLPEGTGTPIADARWEAQQKEQPKVQKVRVNWAAKPKEACHTPHGKLVDATHMFNGQHYCEPCYQQVMKYGKVTHYARASYKEKTREILAKGKLMQNGKFTEAGLQRQEGIKARNDRIARMTRLERVAAGLEQDPYLLQGAKKRDINGQETPGEYAWTTNDPENGPTRGGMKGGYKPLSPIVDDMSGDDL